jgi:hypothetical protein
VAAREVLCRGVGGSRSAATGDRVSADVGGGSEGRGGSGEAVF